MYRRLSNAQTLRVFDGVAAHSTMDRMEDEKQQSSRAVVSVCQFKGRRLLRGKTRLLRTRLITKKKKNIHSVIGAFSCTDSELNSRIRGFSRFILCLQIRRENKDKGFSHLAKCPLFLVTNNSVVYILIVQNRTSFDSKTTDRVRWWT